MREIIRVQVTPKGVAQPYHRVVVTERGSIGLLDHDYRDACRQMTLHGLGDKAPCPCILVFFAMKKKLGRLRSDASIWPSSTSLLPQCYPALQEFIYSLTPADSARACRKYQHWRRDRTPVDRLCKGNWRYLYEKLKNDPDCGQFIDCVLYELIRREHRVDQRNSFGCTRHTEFVNVLLKDLPHRQWSQKVYFYATSIQVTFTVGNLITSPRFVSPVADERVREVLATVDAIEKMLFVFSLHKNSDNQF